MSESSNQIVRTKRPMRFIQVFNRYLQVSGEENSVIRIAQHLEAAGHEVHRFWRSSEEWKRPGAPSRWRQARLMWLNIPVITELLELNSKVQPDAWILHNVIPVISLGIYEIATDLDIPVIQWLHNYRPISPSGTLRVGSRELAPDDPWIWLKETLAGTWHGILPTALLAYGYRRLMKRDAFAGVRAWIAVSDEMRRIFQQAGWEPSRLFTLRHSWDIRPPAQPDTSPERPYFVFLGRMVETKGVPFLIDLWRDASLSGADLVMAGEGPLVEKLRSQSPSNVRWVGFVSGEEKRRLIAGSRAVLFPCQWAEPLSTVAYEAYEQRRPILSSRLGGMKELVQHGVTGQLLPPGEREAWLEAIQELIQDPTLSEKMGQRGRQWLEENVSPAAWVQQFDRILEQALPDEEDEDEEIEFISADEFNYDEDED